MANTEGFLRARHFLNALHILFHFISKASLWGRFYNDSLFTGERLCHEHPAGGLTAGHCTAEVCTGHSVQFSRSVVSHSLRPHEPQHARPPCPSPTPGIYPNSCPLSWWCHPTISSSVVHSPPAFNLSQHQGLFKWVSPSHQVAKVLEFQLQHQSFRWTLRTDLL